jgi:DNA-binding transcriptional LysR family regulator
VGVGPDCAMAVVASPGYLAAHAAPQTSQDLTLHRCVNQRMLASGQTYGCEFEQDGRALDIKGTGPLTYNEPELMLDAALDGLGLAYILEDQVRNLWSGCFGPRDRREGRHRRRDYLPPLSAALRSYSGRIPS